MNIKKIFQFNKQNSILSALQVLLPAVFISAILYFSGCGNNDVNGPHENPLSFDMYDTLFNDTLQFIFHPTQNVTIDSVVETLPQNPSYTVISTNPSYVFSNDSAYIVGHSPQIQIQSGQQWTFTYTGKVVSSGSRYTTSTYFKVP